MNHGRFPINHGRSRDFNQVRRGAGELPPLVVIALAPGAFLSDWADDADAAAALFLGGEATGDALADVLTGRVSPSGRLPLTRAAEFEAPTLL